MKTLAKIIIIAAGVAVAIPVTNAVAPTLAANHPRLRALLVRKAVRERVAQKLGLSADQVAQLKAERAKAITELKAIRADSSLTKEQKKAKARETIQAARSEARGMFDQEQLKKLHRLREHLQARRAGTI